MASLPTLRWDTPPAVRTPHAEIAGLLERAGAGPGEAAEQERREQERPADQFRHLTLVRSGSALVGMARLEVPRSHERPGWYRLGLEVDPAWQDTGLPEALWERARAALPPGLPRWVLAQVREDGWQESFLRARGFYEQERMWSSALDLRGFDPAEHAQRASRAQDAGLQVRTLEEVDLADPAQQLRLYELMIGLLADVPSGEPITPWPFELWRERILEAPDFDPGGVFLLLSAEGEWAGVCELYRPEPGQPHTLHRGLTGVAAAWRGLGGARLLKLAAVRRARERGTRFVRTNNHAGNAAMLAVNDGLGFVRERAAITLTRREG